VVAALAEASFAGASSVPDDWPCPSKTCIAIRILFAPRCGRTRYVSKYLPSSTCCWLRPQAGCVFEELSALLLARHVRSNRPAVQPESC
jgi:hypothetical protein